MDDPASLSKDKRCCCCNLVIVVVVVVGVVAMGLCRESVALRPCIK